VAILESGEASSLFDACTEHLPDKIRFDGEE
jgi:hypothetical protein